MKAAYVKTRNKVHIRDIPTPTPTLGKVLLQVDGCGVCGSDYIEATAWATDWKRFGHEIAATIVSVGEGVEGFAPGDQTVLALSVPCGECPGCRSGNPRRCSRLVVADQGGFAEKLLVKDVRLLGKIPQPISPALLIFVEPLTVLLDAFHTANLQPRDNLLVVGGGFLSCLGILAAKAVGVSPAHSLSRYLHTGLQACLDAVGGEHFQWNILAGITMSAPKELGQRLAGLTGRVVVLHTAPARYILRYLDLLPFDSTVVNIGLSGVSKENIVKLDASRLIFKRLQLLSSFPVPCLHLDLAISLLCKNQELFSLLTPDVMPLESLPGVISATRKSKRKIMIAPCNTK